MADEIKKESAPVPTGGETQPSADDVASMQQVIRGDTEPTAGPATEQSPPEASTPPVPVAEAPTESAAPAAPAATAPVLDPAAFAKTLASEIAASMRQPVAQPAAAAAPAAKPFEFFKVTPQEMEQIIDTPEKAAEFMNSVIDRIRTEYAQITVPFVMDEIKKAVAPYAPIQQHYTQSQVEVLKKSFVDQNPDLKDWIDLAEQIATPLLESREFKDRGEFFGALAQETRKWKDTFLKRVSGNGGQKSTPPPPPPAKGAAPRPPSGAKPGEPQDVDDMRAVIYGPQYR